MAIAKKIISLSVAVALTGSCLFGCADTDFAAKTENTTISVGQYIYHVFDNLMKAEEELEVTPSSSDSNFFELTIDDQNVEDWIVNNAKKDLKACVGASIEFENLGLTLTEEEKTKTTTSDEEGNDVSISISDYYDNLDDYYHLSDLGISKQSLTAVLNSEKKYEKVFDSYYGAGGSQEVSSQEISDYIKTNGASYKMMTVAKRGSTSTETTDASSPTTLTATDESKAEAQGYVDQINGGKSIDDVYHDYEYANGTTDDTFVPLEVEFVFKEDTTSTLEDNVLSALFEQAQIDGPAILIEGDYSFYIIQRYSVSDETVSQNKEQALEYMKDDEFSEIMCQMADTKGYQENEAAFKEYTPKALYKRYEKYSEDSMVTYY